MASPVNWLLTAPPEEIRALGPDLHRLAARLDLLRRTLGGSYHPDHESLDRCPNGCVPDHAEGTGVVFMVSTPAWEEHPIEETNEKGVVLGLDTIPEPPGEADLVRCGECDATWPYPGERKLLHP